MTQPFSGDLDFLGASGRKVVLRMLAAVTSAEGTFENTISEHDMGMAKIWNHRIGGTGPASVWEGTIDGITNERLFPLLERNGWIAPLVGNSDGRQFSDAALTWAGSAGAVDDHVVRRDIGRLLFARWQGQHHGRLWDHFDPKQIASELGVPMDRVVSQASVLVAVGYAERTVKAGVWSPSMPSPPTPYPESAFPHLRKLHLTAKGVEWAASGYPPIGAGTMVSVAVTVDVRVEIDAVFDVAVSNGADPELAEQVRQLLLDLSREFDRRPGEGRWETARKTVETANTSKELLIPVIGFLARHMDKLQGLGDLLG